MVFIYSLYLGVMTTAGFIFLIYPYMKGKTPVFRKLGFLFFIILYCVHDIFMTLINPHISYVYKTIEILGYYFLVLLLLHIFFDGRCMIHFIKIYAVDFAYQAIGTIFSVLVLGGVYHFDMVLLEQKTDVPSLINYLAFTTVTLGNVLFMRPVLKRASKREGTWTKVLALIMTGTNIAASSMNSMDSIIIVIPIILGVLTIGILYQERQLKKVRQQEEHYAWLEKQQEIREEELARIRHDLANHLNVIEESKSEEYKKEVISYLEESTNCRGD